MFAEMIAGWMIVIALIVGAVLLLGRTHRRADPDAWTPADADRDADRRRSRQERRLMAAVRDLGADVVRVGSELNRAARFDRASAELLEPSPTTRAAAGTNPDTERTTDPDDHSLAA